MKFECMGVSKASDNLAPTKGTAGAFAHWAPDSSPDG